MRSLFLLLLCISTKVFAQSSVEVNKLQPPADYDNLYTQKLNSDSNVTSILLWIKKEVKPHKHVTHSEHVYILDGTAKMLLGNKVIDIKAGDFIFIPQNTVHAVRVTSSVPLKLISIQAPQFDGTDRVPVDVNW